MIQRMDRHQFSTQRRCAEVTFNEGLWVCYRRDWDKHHTGHVEEADRTSGTRSAAPQFVSDTNRWQCEALLQVESGEGAAAERGSEWNG